MYKISKVCPFCGHVSEIWVDDEVLKRMEDGERIQDILPELPASEREVLERIQDILPELPTSERKVIISGIRIDCQEEIFADSDEEDDDYAPEPEDLEDLQIEFGWFDPYEGSYTWDC